MKLLKTISLILFVILTASCGKDPCKEVICQNAGSCIEGVCECPPEFEGEFCQYVNVGEYLGTYQVSYEGCFQASPEHSVAVAEVFEEKETISLTGLGDYACPGGELAVEGKVGLNSILLPAQTLCADGNFAGYTYMGQGSRKGDSLLLTFSVSYEADGVARQDNCTATMVKE